MVKLKGLDVSHWQGNVNWSKVKANADFVFVKCSEGSSYVDPNFVSNVKEAAAAGLKVGAYHYATFNDVASAKEQANYFLSKVKGLTLTYPLVLDLEEDKKKAGKQQLTDAAIAFLEVLEGAGYFAIIYSNPHFFNNELDLSRLKPYAKWLADYSGKMDLQADVWQYTQSGKIDGITGNVDLNTCYRDFALEISLMNKSAHAAVKPEYHTVIKGEIASKIAAKHKISLDQLDKLNPSVKDWNLIYPNQKLRVK
jgi:lysozyme